ncbi:MOSC domain-containing protein [Erythrobacter aurantius]|uniref:MOSC domain-containing protein n=1 Tax=Erythrobacter aurantius TaxID=2909249 RepID=UPI00207ABD85|nr:MOSC domain-containing protein [Erythrobacter aurantius]
MTYSSSNGLVVAVSSDNKHRFSKQPVRSIEILAGFGVRGDAHGGDTVRHRSRVEQDPTQPNLRQVHLIHAELLEELDRKGFEVNPGDLGENITTRGVDLLHLGRDTLLRIGSDAVLSVTGLRNPCAQVDEFAPGLLAELVEKTGDQIVRKAGIMCVALRGGIVQPGDGIHVERPEGPHIPLGRV